MSSSPVHVWRTIMARISSAVVLTDAEYAEGFDSALLVIPQPAAGGSTLTAAQQTIVGSTLNKSDKIRGLLGTGMKRGDVAKTLGIRYQHVRNVEITPIKRKA